jgi:hypothetical protein
MGHSFSLTLVEETFLNCCNLASKVNLKHFIEKHLPVLMWHKTHNGLPSVIMPSRQQRRIGPKEQHYKIKVSTSN